MCRSIFDTALYGEINGLSKEDVVSCLGDLSKGYRELCGKFTVGQKNMSLNDFMRKYDIQYHHIMNNPIIMTAREEFRNAIVNGLEVSDYISKAFINMQGDKHIGRVLSPFMIDKSNDEKSKVMEKYGNILLQIESFSGERINTVLDFINSKLIEYIGENDVRDTVIDLLTSIELFFYVFGYYPRVSRDIALYLTYRSTLHEAKANLGESVGLDQVGHMWFEKISTAGTGGYWKNLLKDTFSGNGEINTPLSVLEESYEYVREKRTPITFNIVEVNVDVEQEKITNNEEENNMEEKINEAVKDCMDGIKDAKSKFEEEIKKEQSKESKFTVGEKILIGVGCVAAGIGLAFLGKYLYDEFVDTVEVDTNNNESFFETMFK